MLSPEKFVAAFLAKKIMSTEIQSHRRRFHYALRELCLVLGVMFTLVPVSNATPIINRSLRTERSHAPEPNGPAIGILIEDRKIELARSVALSAWAGHRLRDARMCRVCSASPDIMQAPEPPSFVLVGTGLLTLSGVLRRRFTH